MSRTSQFLLVPTVDALDLVGEPVRCAGPLHTVAVHVSNFTGRVHLEASLVAEPGDGDWFPAVDPLDYPRQPASGGETSVTGVTFRGNYPWLRARVERSHLAPPVGDPAATYGMVDKMLLND